jgi:multidrug transporter EmrE-like cation transporter
LNLADILYASCFLACLVCALLMLRSWMKTRIAFLLWSGLGFSLLSLSNALLFLDKVSFEGVDLAGYRVAAAFLGVSLLVCGAVRETR